jgi:hypothetical protein
VEFVIELQRVDIRLARPHGPKLGMVFGKARHQGNDIGRRALGGKNNHTPRRLVETNDRRQVLRLFGRRHHRFFVAVAGCAQLIRDAHQPSVTLMIDVASGARRFVHDRRVVKGLLLVTREARAIHPRKILPLVAGKLSKRERRLRNFHGAARETAQSGIP